MISTSYVAISKASINQSINQSIDRAVNQSINQSIDRAVSQSINQSINQSKDRAIIRSINSINQSNNPSPTHLNKSIDPSTDCISKSLYSFISRDLLESWAFCTPHSHRDAKGSVRCSFWHAEHRIPRHSSRPSSLRLNMVKNNWFFYTYFVTMHFPDFFGGKMRFFFENFR